MATASAIQSVHSVAKHDSELRYFFSWVFCWILLPNLPFLPVTLSGGPPRFPDVLACGVVGLLVRRQGYCIRLGAFLSLMGFLVVSFIARMFNLAITMVLSVAGLAVELDPVASAEYVLGAGLLAITCVMAAWALRHRADFNRTGWVAGAVLVTFLGAGADYLASRDTMGAYGRVAPVDAPFTSASSQTSLPALTDGRTHLMLVMVEAMGQPTDPVLRRELEAMWIRPELAERYDITHGTTRFYGSTTNGELRELCQRWGDYTEILARDSGCIPALLSQRGYKTISYHGFTADFFDRERWYPHIGFDRSVFGPELVARGAGYCANVFPGACDRNIPALIARDLKKANSPQFVYWLTLNSHLPIVEDAKLRTANCSGSNPLYGQLPMICRLFALWRQTSDALVNVALAQDFPPTHILIVGDHMPPFTHQESRLQFSSTEVPWILLRYRNPHGSSVRPLLK